MIHRSTHRVRSLLAVVGLAGTLALTGCGGHGKYTQEHINRAEERMSLLKSGTEWDLARQAFLAGDLKKAEKKVDVSLALNDTVVKSHVLRGRIMLEQGRMDQALISLGRAEELNPADVDAQYYMGIVYERLMERELALECFQKASELDPSDPQYVVAAAEVMVDMGDAAGAQAYLEEREGMFRHAPGVRQTLGHIAMIRGEAERAVELFHEAQLLAPDDTGIVEDLARAQMRTGRFGDAELALATLMQDDEHENRRDLKHLRVRCLLALDRPVAARTILDQLTQGDEGSADTAAWLMAGRVAVRLDDQGRLREASRRVISLAPEQAEGHFLRAIWLHRMDRFDAALPAAIEAARLDPENPDHFVLVGMIERSLGREQAAMRAFARAVELDPTHGIASDLAGQGTVVNVPID